MRILKNTSREVINTIYKGRPLVIKSKGSFKAEDDEQAEYLLYTYGFLKEVTPNPVLPVKEVKKAEPKEVV